MSLKKTIDLLLRKLGVEVKLISTQNRKNNLKHKWLLDLGINHILDVGANEGQFAEKIRKYFPSTKIDSFEPLEVCFTKLKQNFEKDKNFKAHHFALGNENNTIMINMNESLPSSSILEMTEIHHKNYPSTYKSSSKEIDVKRLDDCNNIVDKNDKLLLKIDVQGYELNVLKGSINSLKFIKVIIVEYMYEKLYEGQSEFDELNDFLKSHNFVFSGIYDQELSPINGKPIFADLIYLAK